MHLSSRFRWIESDSGRITSSTHQWQPQLRARLLFDRAGRYSVNVGAFGGSQFVAGWNNSGGGLGLFARDFNVKQLFVAAEPVKDLEVQFGGLYLTRGESTEVTSYDNDAYIVGERVTLRRPTGLVSQVVATAGYIGDYRIPNVFRRFKRLDQFNYGQVLIGARLGTKVNVSADYTYEDGRDILRQGFTWRTPRSIPWMTGLKVDAYQRVSGTPGQGINVAVDARLGPRLTVTGGVAHIDRNYLAPGYMSLNADRYERGTRFYTSGNFALTRDFSVGWFQGEAFRTNYPIPNEHRFEIIATFSPTATLKARRIF
ncbi:MAG TPA: hypothetical protein VNJ02_19055 [Vicinamibacterales bacterium]|nr:hypothetical protein [Vicinamibacterales bacterium]